MSSDSILVVIDPTKVEQYALEYASSLAEKLHKKLELFICVHDDALIHYREILGEEIFETSKAQTLEKLNGALHKLAEPYQSKKLQVQYDVSWDWPLYEGIIRKALQIKPFMIIKDTHYHSKISRTILGNTDWSLIKHCPYPVMFDKQVKNADSPRIFSCINPINEVEEQIDKNLIELGESLANALNGTQKLLHCYKPINTTFIGMNDGHYVSILKEKNLKIKKMHQNRVEALATKLGIDSDNIVFENGDAKTLIPNIVETRKADLVIMGSQTKSGFKQAFVGSTAEAVLDEMLCNVLVLKPDSFETTVSEVAHPEYPQVVVWPM